MNSKTENQLSRYLRGESSEAESRDLLAWAAENEDNADAFARACIQDEFTSELFEEGRVAESIRPPAGTVNPSRWSFSRRGWAIAAALILSLIGIAVWSQFRPGDSNFAVVAHSVGARLPDGSVVAPDRRVGRETIEIAGGLIRLDFDHGASMTVEGPARFELRDAMHVYFEEGVATFQVPASAKGFTVDTSDAEVVDLGTAFGLAKRVGEETDVCVFEGEVEVEGKLIRAGEAVSARQGGGVEDSAFATKIYERAWPVTSGVLQTTGMMRFVSPGPGFVPGKFEDDGHITVFLERRQVQIGDALEVDLADPGEYRRLRRQKGPRIPAGTKVRSYLLQLDPVGLLDKWDGDKPRVEGQITFDRPIVGLIASGKKLLATDPLLGHPDGRYGDLPRGLEPPKETLDRAEPDGKDVLILAADQRTLILNFAAGSAVDQIRVLVASGS
jgi:ferric-dicitrate binding protein FerR (iron transport regulator)